MAAIFLTTSALEIFLLWPLSPLSVQVKKRGLSETWVSPLSHAIIYDTLMYGEIDGADRKKGVLAVNRHGQAMRSYDTQYPCPSVDAIRIWSEIRGLAVDIPPYDDGVASFPEQRVGPDELLIFATAAAFSIPLVGPQPTDEDTLKTLAESGVKFSPL